MLTHHGNKNENSALNTADWASEGQGKQGTFGVHMLQKSSKALSKRRGGKEGPGQLPTDAGCDQVCNPGKDSKPPACGKKKWVCTLLSLGHILNNMRLDGFGEGEFELSAFLPVAFFISSKVFFLSVRRYEFHPDCTSPFSSSK